MVRRLLGSQSCDLTQTQRENIFHTRCKVLNKNCSLIVDSGSSCNCCSTNLVSKLSLTIISHPKPYKLQWLNEQGKMIVNQQVKIPFSVGDYCDEVLCDIIPMEAKYILLGRPWQFDKKVIQNGLTNEITLTHGSKKFKLVPLTTSLVAGDQVQIKLKRDDEKNRKRKEEQPLMVKEKCKEVSVSSKRLVEEESHSAIKINIKETYLLRQPPHLLLCKRTLVSIATPLWLEVIPQVKKLLDESLVRKSLNPYALLVPKIGIIRHQIPKMVV